MARGSANMILLAVLLVRAASATERQCESEAAKLAIGEAIMKWTIPCAMEVANSCIPRRLRKGQITWSQKIRCDNSIFDIQHVIGAFSFGKHMKDSLPVENAWNEEEEAKMNDFTRKMRGNLETVLGKKFPEGTHFRLAFFVKSKNVFQFRWNNTPVEDSTQPGAGYMAVVATI